MGGLQAGNRIPCAKKEMHYEKKGKAGRGGGRCRSNVDERKGGLGSIVDWGS